MEQSFKKQIDLAKYTTQGLYDRRKELDYLVKALNDQLSVLKEMGMFSEIVDEYERLVKEYEKQTEELISFMLDDVKYIQDQEREIGNIFKIKR